MTEPLLRVEGLTLDYPTETGTFRAVDDVSFDVHRGEILGLAGESGAGKSTVAAAILGLIDAPGRIAAGRLLLDGTDLATAAPATMRSLRGRRIGAVFQDPLTALNPVLTVGRQVAWAVERVTAHRGGAARARAAELLDAVGLPDARAQMRRYPHQLSGGMRQRVVIAIALAGDPDLIIADEPTTALDVSIQKGVLDLLRGMCRDRGIGVILVTHDMAVMAETADRLAVMRHGRIVEAGPCRDLIAAPTHPYVRRLIAAVPPSDRRLDRFEGVDDAQAAPSGPATRRADAPAGAEAALEVTDLSVRFGTLVAVADAAFAVARGESFGIVGESGSGKSTLVRAVAGLAPKASGTVRLHGADVTARGTDRAVRRASLGLQMVFQDPFSSLDPRQSVLDCLLEPMTVHGLVPRSERRDRAAALLERVGLGADALGKLPHAFSGGQRQRICIARALVMEPTVLICDEPTSALDVSVQASILNLMKDLQAERGMALIFISHDLSVVRQMCDRTAVMEKGRIVELAPTERIFEAPAHPYTRRLRDLMPKFQAQGAGR
ncbi:ABC transporter ATP-binding protein [Jannaschia sp. LMIT008]|uniref:ABC transporter ATP-binding protein n=1 Tax=Jannaschia maritima TaxID=3032585 RepID=UPI002811FD48|nr:ABC transporter ATP-binding protein [Jannaschia sp. LMIT008]